MTKREFIFETLSVWGDEVEQKLKAQLIAFNIGVTQELLHSLSYKVYNMETELSGRYELSFAEWGRMVDMGAGRGHKIQSVAGNAELLQRAKKLKGRVAKKWYSKTVYGMLGRLVYRLSNNYTDEVINRAVSQLNKAV